MTRNEFEVQTESSPTKTREVTINGITYHVSEDTACIVHAIMCLERTVEEYAL